MARRPRPRLESLEGRYAPAAAQDIPRGDEAPAAVAVPPLVFDDAFLEQDNAPLSVLVTPPAEGDEAFLTPPPLPELMTLIGRLPEPSLEFPPAYAGEPMKAEVELALFVPPADEEEGGQENKTPPDDEAPPKDGEAPPEAEAAPAEAAAE